MRKEGKGGVSSKTIGRGDRGFEKAPRFARATGGGRETQRGKNKQGIGVSLGAPCTRDGGGERVMGAGDNLIDICLCACVFSDGWCVGDELEGGHREFGRRRVLAVGRRSREVDHQTRKPPLPRRPPICWSVQEQSGARGTSHNRTPGERRRAFLPEKTFLFKKRQASLADERIADTQA